MERLTRRGNNTLGGYCTSFSLSMGWMDMKKGATKFKKYCINAHRLPFDVREQIGLEFLAGDRNYQGYDAQIDVIKGLILCMDTNHENYHRHLTKQKKDLVEKLMKNEDVVNTVLCTLFQWFGTNVGRCDIKKIIDEIDSIDHDGKKR